PGKHAIFIERASVEFRTCILVIARQGRKRERPVVVQLNEIRRARVFERNHALGHSFLSIGDVLHQELAVGLKERLHLFGESIHGFVRNQAVGIFSPAKGGRLAEKQNRQHKRRSEEKPATHYFFFSSAAAAVARMPAFESWLCLWP